jgi:hypothetical protein
VPNSSSHSKTRKTSHVASSQLNWNFIVSDLARHLRTSVTAGETRAILDQAERDIALLDPPCDFWKRLEREVFRIERGVRDEAATAESPTRAAMVRNLILMKVADSTPATRLP